MNNSDISFAECLKMMGKFGMGFNAVHGNATLVVVTLNASQFVSKEQRDKTIGYVRKLTQHIEVPVVIIDSSTTNIQSFTDKQLAELGLQRIKDAD